MHGPYQAVLSWRASSAADSEVEANLQWYPHSWVGRFRLRCQPFPEPSLPPCTPSAGSHPPQRTTAHHCVPPRSRTSPHTADHYTGCAIVFSVRNVNVPFWGLAQIFYDVKTSPDCCRRWFRFPSGQSFWWIWLNRYLITHFINSQKPYPLYTFQVMCLCGTWNISWTYQRFDVADGEETRRSPTGAFVPLTVHLLHHGHNISCSQFQLPWTRFGKTVHIRCTVASK